MQIQLTRQGLDTQEINGQHVWPLKISATLLAGSAMPNAKIFVYHASMGDDAYTGDVFECIASLQQYYDLPIDVAVMEGEYAVPYYRRSNLEFYCRSAIDAEDLWEAIQTDVADLTANFEAAAALREVTSVDL